MRGIVVTILAEHLHGLSVNRVADLGAFFYPDSDPTLEKKIGSDLREINPIRIRHLRKIGFGSDPRKKTKSGFDLREEKKTVPDILMQFFGESDRIRQHFEN